MMGLGLALAQPSRRVLVITGDGDLLMQLGSLAAIAAQKPPNLALAVLDNERHGETGMQRGLTASGVDLAGIARACGFPSTQTARNDADLQHCLALLRHGPGPALCAIKVGTAPAARVLPPRDGAYLKDRFRLALLGPAALR
jgi:thiamine pyrophosphate-dependent acetolactate synthase large subunit-like protein